MVKHFALISGSIIFCIILLLLFELAIRLLKPEINNQDIELSLFQQHAFGNSIGWAPNSSGVSFGKKVLIDEYGFRKMTAPSEYNFSWLILGDSVTFGVGVDTEDLFIEKLQKQFPNIKLWNTAVVGYSLRNYKEVLSNFLAKRDDVQKVMLFFTLNDIYGYLNLVPVPQSYLEQVLFFLKHNSKLYMFLKNTLFDRSRTYFMYDFSLYNQSNPKLNESLSVIDEMNSVLKKNNITFAVILLPYEYQLRLKKDEYLKPQKFMTNFLESKNILYIDVYDDLAKSTKDSRELYLYADPMHLSRTGHKLVFNALMRKIGSISR